MPTNVKLLAALAGLFLFVAPVLAHHSFAAEYDVNRVLKLHGTVTTMEWINPHCLIHVDVRGADWIIEAGSPNALLRLGFNKTTLPRGTEVVVEAFQARDGSNRAMGQWVQFPDGRKLFLSKSAQAAQ